MKNLFLLVFSLMLTAVTVHAQTHHEFLATVNYNPFSYARLDSIPGIMWLQDNTAYDANNKRFFLQGTGPAQTPPNNLVILNALTGAVVAQSPLGANLGPGYHVACLQYDNTCDTLYCIAYSGTTFQFGWVDEWSGTVYIKSTIAGINGYAPGISGMDENHHRVFFQGAGSNGGVLVTIDAPTGACLSQVVPTVSVAVYLEYNNTTNHLYAISTPGRLDSINPATGVQYPIALISQMGLSQAGIWAINETTDEFIFCGHPSSGTDSLYTVNLQNGAVIARDEYGYANAANPALENIIFYCMDQQTQTLYALNWGIDSTKTHPNGLNDASACAVPVIFPSPSSGAVTIQFEDNTYSLLNIYDAQGKMCFVMQTGNSLNMHADLSFLSDGVYTLEFTSVGKPAARQKLIIQH